jgi:hypothetical protein
MSVDNKILLKYSDEVVCQLAHFFKATGHLKPL